MVCPLFLSAFFFIMPCFMSVRVMVMFIVAVTVVMVGMFFTAVVMVVVGKFVFSVI